MNEYYYELLNRQYYGVSVNRDYAIKLIITEAGLFLETDLGIPGTIIRIPLLEDPIFDLFSNSYIDVTEEIVKELEQINSWARKNPNKSFKDYAVWHKLLKNDNS